MTEPNPNPTPDPKPDDPLNGLSDVQKAAIQKQIDTASAAARRDGEKAGLTKAQQDAAAKTEEDRVKREQDDAVKRGEFDGVKTSLEQARDAAKAEADAKAGKLTRAETAVATIVADRIKELDALKDAELSAEFAAITDPIDQLEWFGKASTKRALANAGEAQKVANAQGQPRVPLTPKPNGSNKSEITLQPGAIY